jgi:hypothetical protein
VSRDRETGVDSAPDRCFLIVPLSIDALCVSPGDAATGTVQLAGPTIDFKRTPYLNENLQPTFAFHRALTSKTLVLPLGEPSADPLETGVHLHWALPDALAHGRQAFRLTAQSLEALRPEISADALSKLDAIKDKSFASEDAFVLALQDRLGRDAAAGYYGVLREHAEQNIVFPCVPNRWLVTRVCVQGDAPPAYRRWVVESDRVMTQEENDAYYRQTRRTAISIPATPVPGDAQSCRPFRFLGRVFDYEEWKENPDGAHLERLTAVGYSGPSFAAYYPDSMSVFGFQDTLDLPKGATEGPKLTLTYHVIGWYSDAQKDPASSCSVGEMQDRFSWDFSAGPDIPVPEHILCSGAIYDIPWDPAASYMPKQRESGGIKVTIGHTTTEALAALLSQEWGADASPSETSNIESLLDSLQLGLLSRLGPGFSLARLEDALHQSGFGSISGGYLWNIRRQRAENLGNQTGSPESDSLLPDAGQELNELNRLQQQYDDMHRNLVSRRAQLFFDWHKYIYTLYPEDQTKDTTIRLNDADRFLRAQIRAIQKDEQTAGRIDFSGGLNVFATRSSAESLAGQIVEKARQITAALQQETIPYVLERVEAPRFWQPSDPVILLSGEGARAMLRNGKADRLPCRLSSELIAIPEVEPSSEPADWAALTWGSVAQRLLAETCVLTRSSQSSPAFQVKIPPALALKKWNSAWLPLFLYWKVRYRPVVKDTLRKYTPTFITDNFTLDNNQIDYIPKADRFGDEAYTGSSILSVQGALSLSAQIDQYRKAYPEEPASQRLAQIAAIVDNMPLLSQALNGLHEAFLMREQTLQTPVGDPVNSDEENLSDGPVRQAVENENQSAPLPFGGFSPIRGGFLEVDKLQIIDAFGQRMVLSSPPLIRSERMSIQSEPSKAYLSPRLCQPSRLLFRWLDAEEDLEEMNALPATTPICGWLLPNHLDGSLMIYDARGGAVGSLGIEGQKENVVWREAPGHSGASVLAGINSHLRAFLQPFIDCKDSKVFFTNMLEAIESAYSLPQNNQELGMAVLIGRPISLVRASLRLQLMGLPACDLSFDSFNSDMARALVTNAAQAGLSYDVRQRDTGNFTEVSFPVRLGDPGQTDDGLIGFFVEGDPSRSFYSAFADADSSSGVRRSSGTEILLGTQTTGTIVTMLLDPQARVTATTGILPVKTIDIPFDVCAAALKRIEATFLAKPLLARNDRFIVPVPKEPGFRWQWLQQGQAGAVLQENQADDRAQLPYSPQSIKEGWLKLSKAEDANPSERK